MLAKDKHSRLVQKFVNYSKKMFYNIQLKWERLASEKHSSLLGPFISYKENKGL
jgi:hypothetical protein